MVVCRSKLVTSLLPLNARPKLLLQLPETSGRSGRDRGFYRFGSSKNPPRRDLVSKSKGISKDIAKKINDDDAIGQGNDTDSTVRFKPQGGTKQRFNSRIRREWSCNNQKADKIGQLQVPVIMPSGYFYHRSSSSGASSRVTLPAVNAAALLDPRRYCRASANMAAGGASITHGVSKSISGTDAARRLLRGKKEFVNAIRSQLMQQGDDEGSKSNVHNLPQYWACKPAVLEGHGIPPQLFQHCIDMADALLAHYGNAVECTFNNYSRRTTNSGSEKERCGLLPGVLRIRSRHSTNRCDSWPPSQTSIDSSTPDWNHHMSLYLTVMERISCKLALVLKKEPSSTSEPGAQSNEQDAEDDFVSSHLLFPYSSRPKCSVDILKGSFYGSLSINEGEGSLENMIAPPVPIVEWYPGNASTMGHVVIRLQGQAADHNDHFHNQRKTPMRDGGKVTLVFDASFRTEYL